MTTHAKKNFSKKHTTDVKPDPALKTAVQEGSKKGELACAVAFQISAERGVSPAEVGKTADLVNCMIVKCQLGLFGYQPEKKIVKPQDSPHPDIPEAVSTALVNDRLPCKTAWEIARRFNVSKLTLGGICEQLGIKIKPCQLGAF